ncbi:hypothetical protein SLS62_010171 [Diatrype stigma]|uniref:Uncharacterized protein n=1 Tax=Diatrype stigma TaxID=117547 RepID=A0AAN9UAS8_9PEZI
MSSNPAKLRSLYRSILRELPPKPQAAPGTRSPLRQRLRQSFADESAHPLAPAQADQFVQYLRSQRQYTTLLERYNPGMGMDEEERVRLTAKRVGMDLPIEYGGTKE